jgi:hypothetical protein
VRNTHDFDSDGNNLFQQIIDQFVITLNGYYCAGGLRLSAIHTLSSSCNLTAVQTLFSNKLLSLRIIRTSFRSKNFDHRQTRRVCPSSRTGMKYIGTTTGYFFTGIFSFRTTQNNANKLVYTLHSN